MQIKPIKNDDDYRVAMRRIAEIFDAEVNTSEGDELDVLTTLVEAYESKTFPIDPPDPVEAIRFRMEQLGLVDADLVPYLGQRSRVSEVLHRKRRLTLSMIRNLNHGLDIPLDCLVQEYPLAKDV
ncbi:helix-turn-helix domain-containing protein [Pseudidiomarina gelatinasegens]|uniref:helix-turn-helix domain-containing protein n=1 Tax=Pseudidiomarina gelatinasegens TaxID=2487740 RepID=UPI003A977F56